MYAFFHGYSENDIYQQPYTWPLFCPYIGIHSLSLWRGRAGPPGEERKCEGTSRSGMGRGPCTPIYEWMPAFNIEGPGMDKVVLPQVSTPGLLLTLRA